MNKQQLKELNIRYNELCHEKKQLEKQLKSFNVYDYISIELKDRVLNKAIIIKDENNKDIVIYCTEVIVNPKYITIKGLINLTKTEIFVTYNKDKEICDILLLFTIMNIADYVKLQNNFLFYKKKEIEVFNNNLNIILNK